jgi:DNA polymerase I-like protein with 3'-5' exonuclease and polymerase domains
MIAPKQHSTQDSPSYDLLAKLRERLEHRWREVTEESAIAPAVAWERGYYLEKTKRGLERLGFKRSQQRAPALVIPRFSPSGEPIAPQIKPDKPLIEERNGKSRPRKYETPAGTPVRLSAPPRAVPMMRDVQKTLYVTEGDKKGDALASVGEAVIALQGVECWRSLRDWEHVALYGREVIIAYDADVMINPHVQRAIESLAAFLHDRGAVVKYLNWPDKYHGTKTGIDDYLAAGGNVLELKCWAQDHPDEESMPIGTLLAEVQAETVEWLWERRIPLGKITVLDGDPDNGKSVLTTDLAARVTVGKAMPYGFGKIFPQAGVVILSAEDGVGDTIRPRFDAAGGDPNKVIILGNEDPFGIPEDLPKLERAIKRVGAKLVIVDPIMAFLGENINSNSDKDVRSALKPLKQLAERTGAAVVIVRHLNKTPGDNVLYRGGGSIGIIGAARSGLIVGPHPHDEELRVLASQKHNLSMLPESLSYQITSAPNNPDAAVIVYKGVVDMNARDLLKPPVEEQERSAMDEAKDFLRQALAAGERPASEVKAEAEAVGVAWGTLKRAKVALGVEPNKRGTVWYWFLPSGDDGGGGDDHDGGSGSAGSSAANGAHDPVDPVDPVGQTTNENGHLTGKWIKDDPLDPDGLSTPFTTTNNGEKKAKVSQVDQVDHLDQHPYDDLRTDDTNGSIGTTIRVDHRVDQRRESDPLAYEYVTSEEDLGRVCEEIHTAAGMVALDTETSGLDVREDRVRLIQVKTADGSPALVDATAVDPTPLLKVLADKYVIIHNAAYDLAVLRTNYGYVHRGPVADTMLAAQVYYAGTNKTANLQDLLERLLEVEISKEEQGADWFGELTPEMLTYAAADVEHLHELHDVLYARVKKSERLENVVDLENKTVKVVAEMAALGMPVDEETFAECVAESKRAAGELVETLDGFVTELLPEEFITRNAKSKTVPEERAHKVNWNSPQQARWAFQVAGVEVADTNKTTLAKTDHPLADALSTLRKASDVDKRFRNTKVEGGRVHAKWKQLEAETGRMACEKPPMQGVPASLRRAFVAPPGHKLIVSDLSQIEVRVMCALSGDEALRQKFITGEDIHEATAAKLLGKDPAEVTKEERKLSKALVFGLLYGQGLAGFARRAETITRKPMTEDEVRRKFWDPFFELYPDVARWRENTIIKFKRGTRVSYTALGRRRSNLQTNRQALNSPIQGTAADVLKAIVVALYERREEVPGLEIVGLVHDEVLCVVPEERADEAAALVDRTMKEVGEEATNIGVEEDKRVPIDAGTQVCDSWAQKE